MKESYYSEPPEFSKEASDNFENALLTDTVPLSGDVDTSVIKAVGITGRGIETPTVLPWSNFTPIDQAVGEVQIVPLSESPWRAIKRRRDKQAEILRKRLDNPNAVMLVMPGTTYSNTSVWGVFWFYLKVNYLNFPRLSELLKKIRRR